MASAFVVRVPASSRGQAPALQSLPQQQQQQQQQHWFHGSKAGREHKDMRYASARTSGASRDRITTALLPAEHAIVQRGGGNGGSRSSRSRLVGQSATARGRTIRAQDGRLDGHRRGRAFVAQTITSPFSHACRLSPSTTSSSFSQPCPSPPSPLLSSPSSSSPPAGPGFHPLQPAVPGRFESHAAWHSTRCTPRSGWHRCHGLFGRRDGGSDNGSIRGGKGSTGDGSNGALNNGSSLSSSGRGSTSDNGSSRSRPSAYPNPPGGSPSPGLSQPADEQQQQQQQQQPRPPPGRLQLSQADVRKPPLARKWRGSAFPPFSWLLRVLRMLRALLWRAQRSVLQHHDGPLGGALELLLRLLAWRAVRVLLVAAAAGAMLLHVGSHPRPRRPEAAAYSVFLEALRQRRVTLVQLEQGSTRVLFNVDDRTLLTAEDDAGGSGGGDGGREGGKDRRKVEAPAASDSAAAAAATAAGADRGIAAADGGTSGESVSGNGGEAAVNGRSMVRSGDGEGEGKGSSSGSDASRLSQQTTGSFIRSDELIGGLVRGSASVSAEIMHQAETSGPALATAAAAPAAAMVDGAGAEASVGRGDVVDASHEVQRESGAFRQDAVDEEEHAEEQELERRIAAPATMQLVAVRLRQVQSTAASLVSTATALLRRDGGSTMSGPPDGAPRTGSSGAPNGEGCGVGEKDGGRETEPQASAPVQEQVRESESHHRQQRKPQQQQRQQEQQQQHTVRRIHHPHCWREAILSSSPWLSVVVKPCPPPRFAYVFSRMPRDEPFLLPALQESKVPFYSAPVPAGERAREVLFSALLLWIPLAPLLIITLRSIGGRSGGGGGSWRVGGGKKKRRGRKGGVSSTGVVFEDVAGVDIAKAELLEIVRGLKSGVTQTALGARLPRGVLLVGPPGTGKTLLARAVAGEAGVPFFAATASEFVELFVGRGAARVRDLFREARKAAPAVVFIDEIDAVGGVRGRSNNDEREQTLNQLLTELDGFSATGGGEDADGVLLLAATNRVDVLDPALCRAGRISRRVFVPLPDRRGRQDILRVHLRRVRVDGGTATGGVEGAAVALAGVTGGFSGADLQNVVNEAALLADRAGSPVVTLLHLLEAVQRARFGVGAPVGSPLLSVLSQGLARAAAGLLGPGQR